MVYGTVGWVGTAIVEEVDGARVERHVNLRWTPPPIDCTPGEHTLVAAVNIELPLYRSFRYVRFTFDFKGAQAYEIAVIDMFDTRLRLRKSTTGQQVVVERAKRPPLTASICACTGSPVTRATADGCTECGTSPAPR